MGDLFAPFTDVAAANPYSSSQVQPMTAEELITVGDRNRMIADPYPQRLMARDGWGREGRAMTRFAFYLRGHAMRMPPAMLARHLWTKWRRP